MTFEAYEREIERLERAQSVASEVLNAFPRSGCGLTPDHVKANPEWQRAKAESSRAFSELRALNAKYAKRFEAETKAAIQARRLAKLSQAVTKNTFDSLADEAQPISTPTPRPTGGPRP